MLQSPGSRTVQELKVIRDWWRSNICWFTKTGYTTNSKVLEIWGDLVGQSVQNITSWTKTIGTLEYYGVFDDDKYKKMKVNDALRGVCQLGTTAINKCVKYTIYFIYCIYIYKR